MSKFNGMVIGAPREIMAGEQRVAVIPDTVKELVALGAHVVVEKGAGENAYYDDDEYAAAGAEMAASAAEVYAKAALILKVKEPQYNMAAGTHETEMLTPGSALVCFLHPANPVNHATVRSLAARNIISFSLDSIPRISRAQQMDALTSMSTVAGYKSVINAAHHLARFMPMIPTASGIIDPAQVLVVGTGVAGLQSLATAKRLGARIKSLDIRPDANEQARSLGATVIPFELPAASGVGEGGYALRLSEEHYQRERECLAPVVATSDAVILTALVPRERAPILVDAPMVESMKKGSVIVDISIDQGGNCALTRAGEEYSHHGILISGLINIPAHLVVDATRMFARNVFEYIKYIVAEGVINRDENDEIIREAMVTRDGIIVHRGTLKAMESIDQ